MKHPKYPLYMEGDPSPVDPKGATFWTVPTATNKPSMSYDKVEGSHAIRTIGDLFRYTQRLIGAGFGGDPRPSVTDMDRNELLMTLGGISAHRNAKDFGIDGMQLTAREEVARDSSILHHWQHHRWNANGRFVYDLTPEIAHAFLETDLTVVPEDISLPESTCYIAIPASLGLKVWHALTGFHDLDGFFVTLADNFVLVVACGFAQDGRPSYDNALASYTFGHAGQRTIADWLLEEELNPISVKIMGPNASQVPIWTRLIVNALLYIANVREDVRENPDYGVPKKKLEHSKRIPGPRVREKYLNEWRARCRYHVLGEAVRRALEAPTGPAGDGTGASPQVRFSVRGHWRQQPHGPQNSLRKLLWIQPFWKGSDKEDPNPTRTTHIVKVL